MLTINKTIKFTLLLFFVIIVTTIFLHLFEISRLNLESNRIRLFYSYSIIIFSFFAGVAFLLIWHHTINKVHLDPDIKKYTSEDRMELSMWFLAMALCCWAMVGLVGVLTVPYNSDQASIGWLKILSECLSTLNSAFLLKALPSFQIDKTNSWYKKNIQPFAYSNKYIWGVFFIVCILIIVLGYFNLKIWFEIPDLVYSLLTIALLLYHLARAFNERGIPSMNWLVLFTLVLALAAQFAGFCNIDEFNAPKKVLTYIVLFSFKVFSWITIFYFSLHLCAFLKR